MDPSQAEQTPCRWAFRRVFNKIGSQIPRDPLFPQIDLAHHNQASDDLQKGRGDNGGRGGNDFKLKQSRPSWAVWQGFAVEQGYENNWEETLGKRMQTMKPVCQDSLASVVVVRSITESTAYKFGAAGTESGRSFPSPFSLLVLAQWLRDDDTESGEVRCCPMLLLFSWNIMEEFRVAHHPGRKDQSVLVWQEEIWDGCLPIVPF